MLATSHGPSNTIFSSFFSVPLLPTVGSSCLPLKRNRETRWWEGKFVLLWMLAIGGGMWTPVQRLTPYPDNQCLRASVDREREFQSETAQSALTVILKLVTDGLTSIMLIIFLSVQFSCSMVSDSLQPHELQHTRLPCLPTPRAYPNSCPLSH